MNLLRAASLSILLAAFPAAAHELAKGPNGGRVADAGPYHLELVLSDTNVTVYVLDNADKPVDVKGFKALAILTVGGKAQRIALTPEQGMRLRGASSVAVPANAKGVVQLTKPDGTTTQGRFQ